MKNLRMLLFFSLLCIQFSLYTQPNHHVHYDDYSTTTGSFHGTVTDSAPEMVKECKKQIQYECAIAVYWMIRYAVNDTVSSCTATLYDQVKWVFRHPEFKAVLKISKPATTYRKLLEQAAYIAQEADDQEVWSIIKIAIENVKRRPYSCMRGCMVYFLGVASGVLGTMYAPEIIHNIKC
jgi:hypothetical protein